MILTAHQPVYLPWLGFFNKIASADLFCYFDIVQYQKKDYNNRNKIKTNTGALWLSVPVESKDHFEKNVGTIKILQDGWQKKHIKTIELQYKKAPYFKKYFDQIAQTLTEHSTGSLGELNLAMLRQFNEILGIKTPIVIASEYDFKGIKSDLVLDMCKTLGAKKYIFGIQGENYADVDSFVAEGISPIFQNYRHPVYPQLHGEFTPNLSVIDLIFNVGERSIEVLMCNNDINHGWSE